MSLKEKIKYDLATPQGTILWEYGRKYGGSFHSIWKFFIKYNFSEQDIIDLCRKYLPDSHHLQVPIRDRKGNIMDIQDNEELDKFKLQLEKEFGSK